MPSRKLFLYPNLIGSTVSVTKRLDTPGVDVVAVYRHLIGSEGDMLILGIILLVLGLLFKISLLWYLGIILIVIGAVLFILGSVGRPVRGRRHYW